MSTETNLQSTITKYLRGRGCYVLKTRPGVGTPDGCPDIIFLYEGFWGAIEVKGAPKSKWQPLQKETLIKLDAWSWAKRVDPTNWPTIRLELENML